MKDNVPSITFPESNYAPFMAMNQPVLPRKTRSPCPECGVYLDATLYEKSGDVWMAKHCSDHGGFDLLFWKDASLYTAVKNLSNDSGVPHFPSPFTWDTYAHMTTTLAIDPTLRCNLSCPDCFSSANTTGDGEPSTEELLSRVPPMNSKWFRPNIALVGGESTLRDDLPSLIEGLVARKITPRLNTNGVNLLDNRLRARLRRAGLTWVILQFDGFSATTSEKLRGQDLIQTKLEVIELLGKEGFSIHLAVMLAKGLNDSEVGRIIEFSLKQKGIKRLSFYPRSIVGRNRDPSDKLVMHLADVLEAIETGTDGRITREDVLEMKRIWHLLFKATRLPIFRQRICIAPFVLLGSSDTYLTLNRILKPSALVNKLELIGHLLLSLGKILSFDSAAYPDDILLVNIEKFYHTDSFDLIESMNCHHMYLTSKGTVPFCMYNSFHRT